MWIQRTNRHFLFREIALFVTRSSLGFVCVAAAIFLPSSCSRSPSAAGVDAAVLPSQSPRASPKAAALGALEGTVRVRGKISALPALKTTSSVERQCGKVIPDRTLLVNEEGALANAVVFLADVERSSSEVDSHLPKVVLDQRGCAYLPPVIAARAGAALEISNSDPLIHNVRASAESALFNFAMPLQGQKVTKQLPARPAVIHVGCDVHPWMRAVIRTFDHPYFALTDSRGRYRLTIPSGRKKVTFWHERFPEQSLTVEVAADQKAEQNALWSANEVRF